MLPFWAHFITMILKSAILTGFAQRLKDAMLAHGHRSTHSKSGVCIQALTVLTGHSRQICRKYVAGEVIPEPQVLLKLAMDLNISAGWLLFGELPKKAFSPTEEILIRRSLLETILSQQVAQPAFLLRVIEEVSQMPGDEAQLKKVIDLALAHTASAASLLSENYN